MLHDRYIASEADRWTERLLADGWCLLPHLFPPAEVEALDAEFARDFEKTPFCEGPFYGERTKRFGRLLARSRRAWPLVQHPLVLGIVERVLSPWCDTIQLNLTQAVAVHPGALAQVPHRDQDMWRGETGRIEYLVNVMWPFTRYTASNGATRLWSGSHGSRAPFFVPEDNESVPEYGPGSALLILGSTLHAAGANTSDEVRRGMIAGYSLGWLRTYENQFLAYPPDIARTFPPSLAALAGYRQHRPNLGNFEGCCPSVTLARDPPCWLGAVDALRPDQQASVAAHADAQRRAGAA
ncbi:MAG TPA: phytanoyl-CoA dioxygenase family protein [Allosphingosinicella sp.]|nr:phytanoyl-CoA dioxygenase family protein [Allosphingosinicella sp.]